jgi:hypothetical protein
MKPDLAPVFAALRAILLPHVRGFRVENRKGFYALDDESIDGHSVSFAAVVHKARAVSFYLLPTVWDPTLLEGISKTLRSRRVKAGFFNFKEIEKPLFSELGKLVAKVKATWDPAAIIARK